MAEAAGWCINMNYGTLVVALGIADIVLAGLVYYFYNYAKLARKQRRLAPIGDQLQVGKLILAGVFAVGFIIGFLYGAYVYTITGSLDVLGIFTGFYTPSVLALWQIVQTI
jgi:hypothetical protein